MAHPIVMLDVGGVLTVHGPRNGPKKFGFEALTPGALAFVSLMSARWGPQSMCIVSRVDTGLSTPEHTWVYRTLDAVRLFKCFAHSFWLIGNRCMAARFVRILFVCGLTESGPLFACFLTRRIKNIASSILDPKP